MTPPIIGAAALAAAKALIKAAAKQGAKKTAIKANARGLKAANKTVKNPSAPAARKAAADRVKLVPPLQRTPAQKMAANRIK